jgi:hypothetical protein
MKRIVLRKGTAAIVHRGSMDNILRTIRTLARSSTQLDTAGLIT